MNPKAGRIGNRPRRLKDFQWRGTLARDRVQQRRLFCAALFSFGALFAVFILLRSDRAFRLFLADRSLGFLRGVPEVQRQFVISGFPLLVLFLGAVPFGPVFLSAAVLFSGAAAGLTFAALLLTGGGPFAYQLLFIPLVVSVVFFSAAALRLSGLIFRQIVSGGRFRPDYRPSLLCFVVFSLVYELTVLIFRAFPF